jgi:hypothetical protein
MLDISKLACQGNIRETPVAAVARPEGPRDADLWAGKTMLVCRENADPRSIAACDELAGDERFDEHAAIGRFAARRAMCRQRDAPSRSAELAPTKVATRQRTLPRAAPIDKRCRNSPREAHAKRARAMRRPFYSAEADVL